MSTLILPFAQKTAAPSPAFLALKKLAGEIEHPYQGPPTFGADTAQNRFKLARHCYMAVYYKLSIGIGETEQRLNEWLFGRHPGIYTTRKNQARYNRGTREAFTDYADTPEGRFQETIHRDFNTTRIDTDDIRPFTSVEDLEGSECLRDRPNADQLRDLIEQAYRIRSRVFEDLSEDLEKMRSVIEALNDAPLEEEDYTPLQLHTIANAGFNIKETDKTKTGLFRILAL